MRDASTTTSQHTSLTKTSELAVPEGPADEVSRRFALLLFFESESQMRLLEEGRSVVVGRKAPSEVVVDDPSVSHQHARFVRKEDEVWVEDLESRNGTFVRGARISRERLAPGVEVNVGRARIVLAATGPVEPPGDGGTGAPSDVVVRDPRMKQLYEDVARATRADLPILVLGETGVGKEHVARSVHELGPRRDAPFVVVNCAAIPQSLLETTLFGHERGAFTGAISRSTGVFERAHGGVLFLDEIGELTPNSQAALLRAIETRKINRVGSSTEIEVDVRLVAATHCDLDAMVEENTFRSDLYFRLAAVKLNVPPLRERVEEIEPLVESFLRMACREWKVPRRPVSPEVMAFFRAYAWPGNVRQLRHTVERALLLGTGASIELSDLPESIRSGPTGRKLEPGSDVERLVELGLRDGVRRYERAFIQEALRRVGGNRNAAAKLLRVPIRTLFRKLRSMDLEETS